MLEKILYYIKKVIPKPLFRFLQPVYHLMMAVTGNIVYRFPGYKLTVIGVTGTNGKSTTTELIAEVLKKSGAKVGMISTVNIEIADIRWDNKTNRTTLGRWRTHSIMRNMVKLGCKYAVIEVASEGIAWYRIFGIPFDMTVFTNLAPEHLNFHRNMTNYCNTKGKLFKKLKSPFNYKKTQRVSVVNADDEEASYFLSFNADEKYTFGIKEGSIKARNIICKEKETSYDIVTEKGEYPVATKLVGEFNVYNELAAFCIGLGSGISPKKITKVLEKFEGTTGRMERIDKGQNFTAIVDYAVTPDAQEKVYEELNKFGKKRIISVFGATGDRDRMKRPDMGRVASELTDMVVLTDDETYHEESRSIIEEVYSGVPQDLRDKVTIIPDRYQAIKRALEIARKDDIVIITGIGHQKYRNMGGKRMTWDEREIVADFLKSMMEEKSGKKGK